MENPRNQISDLQFDELIPRLIRLPVLEGQVQDWSTL